MRFGPIQVRSLDLGVVDDLTVPPGGYRAGCLNCAASGLYCGTLYCRINSLKEYLTLIVRRGRPLSVSAAHFEPPRMLSILARSRSSSLMGVPILQHKLETSQLRSENSDRKLLHTAQTPGKKTTSTIASFGASQAS